MPELVAEPLSPEAFRPYGEVIEVRGVEPVVINDGRARRYHALASVELGGSGDRAILSIFESDPVDLPFPLLLMERHPLGSQSFQPLDGARWLVVVAEDPHDAASYRAFRVLPGQGVHFHRNVWHHPLLVLDRPARFLVVDRDGPGDNLEERDVRALALRLAPLDRSPGDSRDRIPPLPPSASLPGSG